MWMTPSAPWRKCIQMPRQCFEAVEIVHRKKIVDKWKCRLHASRQRLVIGRSQQRIQPDESVARPLQAAHFDTKYFRIAAIPAVGNQKHDRPVVEDPTAPLDVERAQRLADPSSARPVRNAPGDFRD